MTKPKSDSVKVPESVGTALFTEMVAGALQDYSPPEPDSPRGRILAAARQLFADTGFEGTSTRLVAEAAGVNLAMIHYYYQNKEKLYEQVMIGELLGLFHGVAGSLEKNLPIEEILVSIPINLMLLLRDRPTWAKLFHREVASGGVHLRRIFRNMGERGPAGAREIFRHAYEDGVKRGILRDLPAGSVHELLISIGYSALFFGSIISDLDGRDYLDEKTWNDRLKTLDTLLRRGLLVESKS